MKLNLRDTPRRFTVGVARDIHIMDLGDVHLAPDEQLTFVTESGRRHDFARKDWGFYATPSVNGRLKREGFKTALVRNELGQLYVMVVESDRLDRFNQYCLAERQTVLRWLDEEPLEQTAP